MNFETARQEFSRVSEVHTTTEEFAEMLADSRVTAMLDGAQVIAAAKQWKAWLEREKLYVPSAWSGAMHASENRPSCGQMTIPNNEPPQLSGSKEERQPDSSRLTVGEWSLELFNRRLWRTTMDRPAELTNTQFGLLRHLMSSPGQLVSRAELLKDVFRIDIYCTTNRLDVAVCGLRKKIVESLGSDPIQNHRHRAHCDGGYSFAGR